MVVVFGLFHGIFFLPCILSLIGPQNAKEKSPAPASAASSRAQSSSPEDARKKASSGVDKAAGNSVLAVTEEEEVATPENLEDRL